MNNNNNNIQYNNVNPNVNNNFNNDDDNNENDNVCHNNRDKELLSQLSTRETRIHSVSSRPCHMDIDFEEMNTLDNCPIYQSENLQNEYNNINPLEVKSYQTKNLQNEYNNIKSLEFKSIIII